MHFSFFSLLVCYARISRFVSSAVCLSVTQESRALFLLQFVYQLRKNLLHCFFCSLHVCYVRISGTDCFWFVGLLRKSLMHFSFFSLLVCYARISRAISFVNCLSVTQESRTLFLLQFAFLLRQNLAHRFFFDLLVCCARISRTASSIVFSGTDCFWFVGLLRKSLMHFSFFSLLVCYARISRAISFVVCLSVTQESRALFLLQFAYLLRQNLAHRFFFDLLVCYARVSCIVSCVNYLSLTREFRAQFIPWVCWSVVQESRALSLLQFSCLLCKNLAHYFFCRLFVSYARISRTVSSVVCLSVAPKSRAPFLL